MCGILVDHSSSGNRRRNSTCKHNSLSQVTRSGGPRNLWLSCGYSDRFIHVMVQHVKALRFSKKNCQPLLRATQKLTNPQNVMSSGLPSNSPFLGFSSLVLVSGQVFGHVHEALLQLPFVMHRIVSNYVTCK